MPIGSTVEIEGPFGNLTLHNDTSRPAILLACGIDDDIRSEEFSEY